MNKSINILVIEPGYKPYTKKIEDSLREFQNVVEGDIESFYPFANESIVCFCNDEGLINGLDPNWAWYNRDFDNENPHSMICGTFFVVGDDGKGGNRSLTEKEIAFATDFFLKDRVVSVAVTDFFSKDRVGSGTENTFVYSNKPEEMSRYLKVKKEGKTNERNCN